VREIKLRVPGKHLDAFEKELIRYGFVPPK
jgi:hypothetical protein